MNSLLPLKDETPRALGARRRQSWDLNAGRSLTSACPPPAGPHGRGSPSPTSPLRASRLQEVRVQHLNRKPLTPRSEGERLHTVCAVPSGVKVPFKKTMKTEKSCNDPGQLETQTGTPSLKTFSKKCRKKRDAFGCRRSSSSRTCEA